MVSLFGEKKGPRNVKIICPKCLTEMTIPEDTEFCPAVFGDKEKGTPCGYQFPIRYIKNSEAFEPLFLQVFGWTSHGKTVFLDVMRLLLLDMRKFWGEYTHQSITELDMQHDRILRSQIKKSVMPDPTVFRSRAQNEVYVMLLDKMLRWGSRSLVIMDHAGEMFARFNVPADEMPFLVKTPTTFMLISIPRLKSDNRGETMDELLNIYVETMLKNGVNFKRHRRNLVIVLTMADLITDLPANLRNYLISDNLWERLHSKETQPMSLLDMEAYIERMGWVNNEIREWLLRDAEGAPGGANLVGLLERENINARFSLISATGYDVQSVSQEKKEEDEAGEPKIEGIQISPRRVLDPFFWALEFQSR